MTLTVTGFATGLFPVLLHGSSAGLTEYQLASVDRYVVEFAVAFVVLLALSYPMINATRAVAMGATIGFLCGSVLALTLAQHSLTYLVLFAFIAVASAVLWAYCHDVSQQRELRISTLRLEALLRVREVDGSNDERLLAGWYLEEGDAPQHRWWDGSTWQ